MTITVFMDRHDPRNLHRVSKLVFYLHDMLKDNTM